MKISLQKIYDSHMSIRKLLSADLPVKTAFKLSRLAKELNGLFQDVEAQRIRLVEKYGEKDEKGHSQVTQENMEQFSKEITELFSEEVEVDFSPISIEELEGAKLSAFDMEGLSFLIME